MPKFNGAGMNAVTMVFNLFISITLFALTVFGQAKTDSPARPLPPGQTIERELGGGETHAYIVKAEAGKLLNVTVMQRGVDVAVRLFAPDGKLMVERDSPNGMEGEEPVMEVIAETGEYRIEVAAFHKTAAAGKYSIMSDAPRIPTEKDKSSISAQVTFDEATALVKLGTAVSLRSARAKFHATSELYGRAGNQEKQYLSLGRAGQISQVLGDLVEAAKTLNQALSLVRVKGNKEVEAATLSSIGYLYMSMGDSQAAVKHLDESLSIARAVDNKVLQANVLNYLSSLFLLLGNKKLALQNTDEALSVSRFIGNKSLEAVALANKGMLYASLSDNQSALKSNEEALALFRGAGDKRTEATVLNNIGNLYHGAGDMQKALKYYNEALPLHRLTGNPQMEAATMSNLGLVSLTLGNTKEALGYFNDSLSISRAIDDKMTGAVTLVNIGLVYLKTGERQTALKHFNDSLQISRAAESKPLEATTLLTLGFLYLSIGDKETAFESLDKALSIARSVSDKNVEALALNNLGGAHHQSGDKQKALKYYNEALSLARVAGNKDSEAVALDNIGWVYGELGDNKSALRYSTESLVLARAIENKVGEANALNSVGKIHENLGDKQAAIKHYNESLSIYRQTQDKEGEAIMLYRLMNVWDGLKNPRFAVFYGKQAVNVYQQLRSNINTFDKEQQRGYVKSIEKSYRLLSDVLIGQGRISEAEQVLAMLKEDEYLGYLRRDDKVAKELSQNIALSPGEREALVRYNTFAGNITSIGRDFADLDAQRRKYPAGEFPKQARFDELKQQLSDATLAFQKFLDELKLKFGQKDERVTQIDSSLQATLKRLKANRTAIVSTIISDDRLNLIVTTANTQRPHSVEIKSADLNKLIVEFRQALTNPAVDPRPVSQKLYDVLVKPIEADLSGIEADTILWSLDGTLRYIPTAALWDAKKGYLAERFAGAVLTLASRDTLSLPVSDKRNWNALGVGVSKATEGFTALTAVPDELDCIITDAQTKTVAANPKCQNGVMTGTKLLDEKFTLPAFENSIGQFPVVHIASHFSLNPGNDKDSFLLLGGGEQKRFTVENLRGVSLADVELIVLSACNTATPGGERANGIEIEGFAAVAQKQGAKAVMATLWSVADTSTSDLMVNFYALQDKNDLTKAEAIRQAQLAMISGKQTAAAANTARRSDIVDLGGKSTTQITFKKDNNAPYAHPFYWAPFVLIGNWR